MAQYVVVDKNSLEHPSLEGFLVSDSENRAVLTDFLAIESFAGGSAVNLIRSVKILNKFPRQVFVLKSSTELTELGSIDPNFRFDMVDWDNTRDFSAFCDDVRKLEEGDDNVGVYFAERATAAQRHLDILRDRNDAMVEFILALRNATDGELLEARRTGKPQPGAESVRLLKSIDYLARSFFRNDPQVPPIPDDPLSASRCYAFRMAIAIRLLALKWAEHGGGVADAKPEKLRNDFVDAMYGVAATYWDDFLTMDNKAYDIYAETQYLANVFFPRMTTG